MSFWFASIVIRRNSDLPATLPPFSPPHAFTRENVLTVREKLTFQRWSRAVKSIFIATVRIGSPFTVALRGLNLTFIKSGRCTCNQVRLSTLIVNGNEKIWSWLKHVTSRAISSRDVSWCWPVLWEYRVEFQFLLKQEVEIITTESERDYRWTRWKE